MTVLLLNWQYAGVTDQQAETKLKTCRGVVDAPLSVPGLGLDCKMIVGVLEEEEAG